MRSSTIAADPGTAAAQGSRAIWQGLALAFVGSIAFSGKAIIVKLAYRYGVDAVTLIMYRMLFALPLFALLAWWAGRGKPALTRRDWIAVCALGFSGYYLASFLDFAGLAYITASLERLILYLNPTLVLGLGALLFKRRVSRRQLIALAVSYAGVLVVFGHEVRLQGRTSRSAPRSCSAARSATRSTSSTAARRSSASARCASPGSPAASPACSASRSSCCCGRCRRSASRPRSSGSRC